VTRPLRAVVVVTAALALPGCTSFADTTATGPTATGSTAVPSDPGPAPEPVGEEACPE
jgi:hypothetical protein